MGSRKTASDPSPVMPTGVASRNGSLHSLHDPVEPVPARVSWLAIFFGIASATTSALVTALLLLLNGSLTLVLLQSLVQGGGLLRREGVLQFALFVVPLLLVAAQWMAWDALCRLFIRDDSEKAPWNST